MRFSVAIVFLLAMMLVSCMPQQPDQAGLKKAVDEFDAVTKESMTSGNTEKVMPFYADDAMSMPPNMPALNGKAAIESWSKEMHAMGMKINSAEFGTTELKADGKTGIQIGTYAIDVEMPGMGQVKDEGKYVTLWKQMDDGSWKIRAEIWNSNNPVPGMENMGKKEEKGTKKK